MSADVKVHGKLVFADPQTIDGLLEFDFMDEDLAEVGDLVAGGVQQVERTLVFIIDGNMSNSGNLEFQEWLSDVAEEAAEGCLNTWQEALGDSQYVRLHAGGEEEEVEEPYPG